MRCERLVALAALVLAGACSDAHLYGKGMEDPTPDRLGLTGRVCTDDAREAGFPVRVLFLVDTAMGAMFADFDPELARLRALSETIARHSGSEAFSFSVASFGPYARLLAPLDGGFTTNPGELDNAVATLGLPQGCLAGVCRDYDDGLDLARSVIEGDLADQSAGSRLRTQYVVVLLGAGPPTPLNGTWDEVSDELVSDVVELREAVEDAGALSFSLHALQLAAWDPWSPNPAEDLDATEDLLQEMSFVGAGRFERFDVADAISLEGLGLLKLSSLLDAKSLLVTNLNVLPGIDGAVIDSDRDGLGDPDEDRLGTDPRDPDSDGDGLNDMIELLISMDPLVAEEIPSACSGLDGPPWADTDSDLLDDCEERLLGTDPSLPDSDGDAAPDWVEVVQRTDYLHHDTLDDADRDGTPNGDELANHTDPGSSDATSHLSDAYRYEVTDEGLVVEPVVWSPRTLSAVETLGAGPDTSGGLGVLSYQPGDPPTLSWLSPRDEAPGPAVSISEPGRYRLDSSSVAAEGLERWITVDVQPALLPPTPVEERLLVELSERACLQWTVRNVRLVETEPDGHNDVFVFFAESPQDRLTRPGLFRVAHLPVEYHPETGRDPADPLVRIDDEEFASIGD